MSGWGARLAPLARNDQKEARLAACAGYAANLRTLVAEVREGGATPVAAGVLRTIRRRAKLCSGGPLAPA